MFKQFLCRYLWQTVKLTRMMLHTKYIMLKRELKIDSMALCLMAQQPGLVLTLLFLYIMQHKFFFHKVQLNDVVKKLTDSRAKPFIS